VREEVCASLLTIQSQFIKWLSVNELKPIADAFEKKTGFPGIVGAVDGTHIAIPGPKDHRASYINRKGFPSVQLQVVSDSNLRLLDVYTGWSGACHDARVFRNSPLGSMLELNTLPTTYHLLGEWAIPLIL